MATNQDAEWQAQYKHHSLGFELERMLPGKVQQTFNYDSIGRLTQQEMLKEKPIKNSIFQV